MNSDQKYVLFATLVTAFIIGAIFTVWVYRTEKNFGVLQSRLKTIAYMGAVFVVASFFAIAPALGMVILTY